MLNKTRYHPEKQTYENDDWWQIAIISNCHITMETQRSIRKYLNTA